MEIVNFIYTDDCALKNARSGNGKIFQHADSDTRTIKRLTSINENGILLQLFHRYCVISFISIDVVGSEWLAKVGI